MENKNIFLTKNMDSFENGSFESFSSIEEAIQRASDLNFKGYIFIGNLITIPSVSVFYTDTDCTLKSRNFSGDCYGMINFINTHEIMNVRKSLMYSINDTKIFGVNFEDVLDMHKIAHL